MKTAVSCSPKHLTVSIKCWRKHLKHFIPIVIKYKCGGMVLFWDFIALPRAYMESLRQGEQLIGYTTEQVSITLISQTA